MESYVALINYTLQGIQNFKDAADRVNAARAAIEAAGGAFGDGALAKVALDIRRRQMHVDARGHHRFPPGGPAAHRVVRCAAEAAIGSEAVDH